MDEAVNRYARELVDAVAGAVSRDPRVDGCRHRARAAGYDLHVTLDVLVRVTSRTAAPGAPRPAPSARETAPSQAFEVSASDRRFLRSLRISADETAEEVE